MARPRISLRPGIERLDARAILSAVAPAVGAADVVAAPAPTTGSSGEALPPAHLVPGSHPSADRFRAFTTADLAAYAKAYETFGGGPGFNPAYDFNGTGFIGQNDATPILRGLAAITPKGPLKLALALDRGQQVVGHHPANNGGVTRLGTVTIVGKTTPNSIVFTDATAPNQFGATGNFKFQGPALYSGTDGYFRFTVKLAELSKNSLTAVNFLIRTPFNQQTIRAFPIFRVG